jgi:hypothetical protein
MHWWSWRRRARFRRGWNGRRRGGSGHVRGSRYGVQSGTGGTERGSGVDGERDREDDGVFERRAVRTVVREIARAFERAALVTDIKMGDPVLPFVLQDPLDGPRRGSGEGVPSETGFDATLQDTRFNAGLRALTANPDETHGFSGSVSSRRRGDDDARHRESPSRDSERARVHGERAGAVLPPSAHNTHRGAPGCNRTGARMGPS